MSNGRRETDHQTDICRRHEQSSKNGYSPERQHYCRGCGESLPPGRRGLFHPSCLKDNKVRRVRERRRAEQERFGIGRCQA